MVSGASGMGSRRGVSRRSLRLISAMRSVAPCVIVTFFAFGVAFGLVAFVVVSFFFFGLAFGVGSCSVCGGFVASVFSFAVWRWIFLCAAVSCLRFVIRVLRTATSPLN